VGVYRTVESERPVLVERDGVWYAGELQGWRRKDGGWLALVQYVGADDVHYLELAKNDRIRRGTDAYREQETVCSSCYGVDRRLGRVGYGHGCATLDEPARAVGVMDERSNVYCMHASLAWGVMKRRTSRMRDSSGTGMDHDWRAVVVWLGIAIAMVLFWTGVASIALGATG